MRRGGDQQGSSTGDNETGDKGAKVYLDRIMKMAGERKSLRNMARESKIYKYSDRQVLRVTYQVVDHVVPQVVLVAELLPARAGERRTLVLDHVEEIVYEEINYT